MPQISDYDASRRPTLLSQKSEPASVSIVYLIRRLFLYSLPHFVIIALFLVYSLLGAAILNEIESSDRVSDSSSWSFKAETRKDQDKSKLGLENAVTISSLIQQHTHKTHTNLEHFYSDLDETIHTTLNLSRSAAAYSASDSDVSFDQDELETFTFFSRLYHKHKSNLNVEKMFKTIARHMIEYKARLKANLTSSLKNSFEEFGRHQVELNRELEERLRDVNARLPVDSNPSNWRFSNYAYFIGSYLTTIGYGNKSPRTVIGKLFTMIYLIFGLPLALILLSDLGAIITRLIKFTAVLICTVYRDGYYDNFKSRLDKRRRALFEKLRSSTSSRAARQRRSSADEDSSENDGSESSDDDDHSRDEKKKAKKTASVWRAFLELGFKCAQQTNDEFDLSLGTSITFVVIYLTLGAIAISRMSQCSLFNGFFSSLIALTKISYGELVNENNAETKFTFFFAVYALLGMAFFDLTMLSLQEKMRVLLIKNAHNILSELVKFANQLGYSSWSMESVNLNDLGRNSIQKIYSRGLSVPQAKPEIDLDEVFYPTSFGRKIAHNKSSVKSKKKAHQDQLHELDKCDKQTQITTLLCSKFKYGKSGGGLSSSLSSINESVMSIIDANDDKAQFSQQIIQPATDMAVESIQVTLKNGSNNGNGNEEAKLPTRRSRFASANAANLTSSSATYQRK